MKTTAIVKSLLEFARGGEWETDTNYPGGHKCLECDGNPEDGHSPECALSKAIKAAEEYLKLRRGHERTTF